MKLLAAALVVLALVTPLAAAHQSAPDPLTGMVSVPQHGTVDVPVQSFHADDTVAYTYAATENASTLSASLVWTDKGGVAHVVPLGSGVARSEGKFDAPSDMANAVLRFTETSDATSTVAWSTLSSASFWKHPELFLPSMIPIFLGIGAVVVAWLGNRWLKKQGRPTRVLAPHEREAWEREESLRASRSTVTKSNEPKEVKSYR